MAVRRSSLVSLLALTAIAIAAGWPRAGLAATQPRLGSAAGFAALGGSTITNTGNTVITGDLGLHPGTSVTGFPPGTVSGTQHLADAVAQQAKTDLGTAYDDAANATTTSDLSGQDLGGKSLTPGVYTYSSSAQLTGSLTLNGDGVYIFRIGTTLTTAGNSVVNLSNGAQACSVWWQVGSSATLGGATRFQGNLMALTSITLVTGANILNGRAMARNGALTLDTNRVTAPTGACTLPAAQATATPAATATPTVTAAATATPAAPAAGATPTPTASPGPSGLAQTGGGQPPRSGLPAWPALVVAAGGGMLLARRAYRRTA